MSYEEVEALVGVLQGSATLTELEVRKGDRTVRLRRTVPSSISAGAKQRTAPMTAAASALASGAAVSGATVSPAADSGISTALVPVASAELLVPPTRIAAGLVGGFHPSRTAPVAEDQTVKKGQVLGQIEAMRLMNDVVATTEGRILSVLVLDGQPVQYGQPLFEIVPAE